MKFKAVDIEKYPLNIIRVKDRLIDWPYLESVFGCMYIQGIFEAED